MELSPRAFFTACKQNDFLRGLTIRQAEELLSHCDRVRIDSGTVLIKEGDTGQGMYVLVSGKIKIYTHKGKVFVADIEPISTVGEMGLLLNHPRTATAVASEFSQLFRLTPKKMEELFKANPQIEAILYRNLAHILCERLEKNNIRIE